MTNSTKYASNKKTQVLGYKYGRFRGSVGMGIPTGCCCGYGTGMGIEIQSPRQPWQIIHFSF